MRRVRDQHGTRYKEAFCDDFERPVHDRMVAS
jgi:hypothetical protein